MTMAPRSGQVLDNYGRAVPGASIYVYDAYGNLASLTSNGVTSISNPLKTDAFGNYSYQAVVAYYREDIWFSGQLRWSQNNVALGSPGADLALRSDVAASSGAALVGFVQSGTGAASRTAQSKMRDVLTPQDFGAVGNGIADDTLPLQAAINEGASSGKPVFLAGGTFIASALSIPTNSAIRGPGTIKRKSAATGYLLYGVAASSASLRDFIIDGNSATGDASAMVRFEGASDDLVIDRLTIKNAAHDCISIAGSSARAQITNNRCLSSRVGIVIASTGGHHYIGANECRSGSASGILVAAPYTSVEGNRCISNGTGLTSQAGVLMLNCLYPLVNGNLCLSNGTGVYFSHGIQFNGCTNGVMSGNICNSNNGSGLDMYSSVGSSCTANQALSNNLRGIEVDTGASYAIVTGNIVQGNQETGISVFNTIGAVVTGNTVSGNGTLGTATNPLTGSANKPYGIALDGAGNYGNYANVSNNVISANVGSGANGVGVYINPSCVGVVLKANLVTSNTSAATVVAANLAFAGENQGLYFEQYGSATILSGNTSVAVSFPQTMSVTPSASQVMLTALNAGTNAPGEIYPTSVTTSGMTINCRNNPGAGGLSIAWRIKV